MNDTYSHIIYIEIKIKIFNSMLLYLVEYSLFSMDDTYSHIICIEIKIKILNSTLLYLVEILDMCNSLKL